MKKFLVLIALTIVACTKAPEERVEIDYFRGIWTVYIDPYYHVEGSCSWYINDDTIMVCTYDWYSDTTTKDFFQYTLYQKDGKYIVVLHPEEGSETEDQSYYITQLTDLEMRWESVDNPNPGKHFVSSKYLDLYDHY